jgi:hypothetical protein
MTTERLWTPASSPGSSLDPSACAGAWRPGLIPRPVVGGRRGSPPRRARVMSISSPTSQSRATPVAFGAAPHRAPSPERLTGPPLRDDWPVSALKPPLRRVLSGSAFGLRDPVVVPLRTSVAEWAAERGEWRASGCEAVGLLSRRLRSEAAGNQRDAVSARGFASRRARTRASGLAASGDDDADEVTGRSAGRRASGVGRRASGVGRRASGVGRRASGIMRHRGRCQRGAVHMTQLRLLALTVGSTTRPHPSGHVTHVLGRGGGVVAHARDGRQQAGVGDHGQAE